MFKKYIPVLSAAILSAAVFSCNSGSEKNLMEGTWQPEDPQEAASSKLKLKFLENNIAIIQIDGRTARPEDSATYEMKNGGKILSTTEKNGKTEQLKVLQLTETKLVLASAGRGDTMRLVRVMNDE